MASWSTALAPHSSTLLRSSSSSSSSLLCVSSFRLPLHFLGRRSVFAVAGRFRGVKQERSTFGSGQATPPSRPVSHICKAAEYKFPDPIPEFAAAETEKFRNHMLKRLSKRKDIFGDSVEDTVAVCAEIFETFLHAEYGGPGTLLVMPFIDMADTVNERGLPGGPQAARAAVKWAQDNVDKDWKEWTGTG